ncbi:MAG: PqqD family protein [Cyanobacteria bacterium]|nr:PqqD family protein [Cyanobacteriota bacterium]
MVTAQSERWALSMSQQRSTPTIVSSSHEDGSVLLDLEYGRLFDLNRLGTLIWERMSERRTPEAIAQEVSRSHHVSYDRALRDVRRFGAQLEQYRLLAGRVVHG